MINLRDKVLTGLSWSFFGQIGIQLLSFSTWIIIARILNPLDFGLIAMILVISGFLRLFRNLGLVEAVIQSSEVDDETISSVYWMHIFLGILISLLFWSSGSLISWFYDELLLKNIIGFFALEILIGSFQLIPFSLMNKKLDFKNLFIVDFISILLSSVVGIAMAYMSYGYWALVYKSVVLTTVSTILIMFFCKWRPLFSFKLKHIIHLISFSLPLFGTQVIKFLIRNIDDLMIGQQLGKQPLGLYNRSYTLMLLPLGFITNSISKVLFPALSIIQDDKEVVKNWYLKSTRIIALISFPLMAGLHVLTNEFILVLLGSQWVAMIPILKILSLLGLFQSVSSLNGSLFLAMNATKTQFKLSIFSGIFVISFILLGIYFTNNIVGVAAYYAFASCFMMLPIWVILGRLINLSLFSIIKNLLPILGAALIMGGLLEIINLLPLWQLNVFSLMAKTFLGIIIYLVVISLFKVNAYTELKVILTTKYLR